MDEDLAAELRDLWVSFGIDEDTVEEMLTAVGDSLPDSEIGDLLHGQG